MKNGCRQILEKFQKTLDKPQLEKVDRVVSQSTYGSVASKRTMSSSKAKTMILQWEETEPENLRTRIYINAVGKEAEAAVDQVLLKAGEGGSGMKLKK